MERSIKRIGKDHKTALRRLRKKEQEWLRVQGKEKVYHADVELDQIMTYFRVAFSNLSAYLLTGYFVRSRLSLGSFVHDVFYIPATIEETKETKRVLLEVGEKDRETITALGSQVEKINRLNIKNLEGQRISFELAGHANI